jgi:chemotaxis protein CheX
MQTAPATKPAGSSTAKLIIPFVNSVRLVFETMVKVQTTVNAPRLKADPCPTYDVSGIIGFSGDVIGSVVVSLQMHAAKSLVAAFAGCPIEPGTPDFSDAIGELANMIAGGAKKHLGANANITVPSVIIGPGHQIARLSGVPCIVIPCSTPAGDFAVEVNVKQIIQSLQ